MRSAIGKELRKQFGAELRTRLPAFKRAKGVSPAGFPRWVFEAAPDLIFFIKLQALPRHDEFVLEVGWTDGGPIEYRENYQSEVNTAARRWGARLSQFWFSGPGGEPVWEVAPRPSQDEKDGWGRAFVRGERSSYLPPDPPVEEILPRVGPLVKDAVDKLEEYAIPVFRRVANERGLSWPK